MDLFFVDYLRHRLIDLIDLFTVKIAYRAICLVTLHTMMLKYCVRSERLVFQRQILEDFASVRHTFVHAQDVSK